MSKLYIRVRKDGFIYEYNEILAKNAECEVITEEQAYPERFVPRHLYDVDTPAPVKTVRTRRKAALDLATADIPEAPLFTPPELAEDASRGL